MSEKRRVGWPVVAVLFAFVLGAAYVAYRTHEDFLEDGRGPARGIVIDAGADDSWVHHTWRADAGAPALIPRTAMGIEQAQHDRVYDPQRWAMVRELGLGLGDAGGAMPFEPLDAPATITSLTGTLPFDEDAECSARVLPARSGRFNCLVRVVCDGHVVYPNPTQTAGYMRCELDGEGQPVRAIDLGHTAVDGDPRVRFERDAQRVTVSDAGDGVAEFELVLSLGASASP